MLNNVENEPKDEPKDDPKELTERQRLILECIRQNETITRQELTQKTKVSDATIKRELLYLQSVDVIKREGGRKDGRWVIL